MSKPIDVDAYIAHAANEARPHLEELRAIISSTIPNAEEKIWYNVPFYFYHGELVGFSVLTQHVSFGIGAEVFDSHVQLLLREQGYKTGKGTFQIKFNQQIPTSIVEQLLHTKAKFNETKYASK